MRSLHARLALILLCFLLLLGGSTVATILGLRAQASDALVINLAGRQRMRVQEIAKDALLVGRGESGVALLQEADRAFATELATLVHGGPVRVLSGHPATVPATRDPAILEGLRQVQDAWVAFHSGVARLIDAPPGGAAARAAVQALERGAPELIRRTDVVVSLYEAASARKIARLRVIQAGFLTSGLVLLVAGIWTTRRFVLRPLRNLSEAAGRIGSGDLGSPVPPQDLREMATVARSLETMRGQLQASQQRLRAWAEELEERVARRTRELVALYDVNREISSRLDIGHILRSVTEKARELLGADVAVLCLIDESGRLLNVQSMSGPKEAITSSCLSVREPPARQVLAAEQALVCGGRGCAGSCGMLNPRFRVSHLATSLRVVDRVIGALCVCSRGAGAFPADAPDLLTKLGNSVAVALENARLYEQAERLAMLEERQRIASEMHDGAAQTLSFLEARATEISALAEAGRPEEAADTLSRIRDVVARASREMRQAIAALSEPPRPRLPLHEQISRLLRESGDDGAAGVGITSVLLPSRLSLPPEESEQVLRVVREALQNAKRHAFARRVTVRLQQQGTEASVTVEDDGRGFDPKAPWSDDGSHFGMSIMRARAARLGGRLEVVSAPGEGTRVRLRWPIGGGEEIPPAAARESAWA